MRLTSSFSPTKMQLERDFGGFLMNCPDVERPSLQRKGKHLRADLEPQTGSRTPNEPETSAAGGVLGLNSYHLPCSYAM